MHGIRRCAKPFASRPKPFGPDTGAVAFSRSTLARFCRAGLGCAFVSAAAAQAPQPFLPPKAEPHFSLSAQIAALDLNRDGSADVLSPGLFFGTVLATLDEHGNTLAKSNLNVGIATNLRSPIVPTPVTMASGDLDHDGRRDLVFTLADGTLHLQRNLGATRIDQPNFAPAQAIDYLGSMLPTNPPFAIATFAALKVLDLNGDGLNDIVLGCGLHDTWSAFAGQGVVAVYLANGNGGFQPIRYQTTGSISDIEWADIDGDGQPDHLVVLQESGAAGAYLHEMLHLSLQNGALVSSKPPLLLGPGRPVALEVGDVDLDGLPDYVVAMLHSGGGAVDSSVVCFAGDGNGTPNVGTFQTLPLPAMTTLGSYIPSVQVEDFNRDGVLDVACVRGHITTYPTLTQLAHTGAAEVYVCMGPTPFNATAESLALDGACYFGHCLKWSCNVLPLRTEPDQLRVLDLGSDGNPDLMMSAIRPVAQPTTIERITLCNGTPPQFGDCAFVKVGDPSGGDPQLPARIGFDGGEPRLGNGSFACTIQNLHANCLCGLMWGPYGMANIANVYGFDLHIGPQEFGYATISSGPPNRAFASYALPIPNDPSLIGDAGYFQFNYYDPAVGAFGATQATGVWIGS
jgi:hypothetical protein